MISIKHPHAYLTLLIATFFIILRFCYGGTPCSPHLTDGKPLNVIATRTEKLQSGGGAERGKGVRRDVKKLRKSDASTCSVSVHIF
jgi:hypothetical protein